MTALIGRWKQHVDVITLWRLLPFQLPPLTVCSRIRFLSGGRSHHCNGPQKNMKPCQKKLCYTRYDSALWTLFFFLLFLLNNMLNILFIYCLNDVGFFACKWNWSFFSLNNCIMMNWSAGICVHLSAAVCQYGFSLRSSCHAKHHSCSSAPLFPSVLWCQNSLILPGGNHCTLFGYYVYKQCTVLHLFFNKWLLL